MLTGQQEEEMAAGHGAQSNSPPPTSRLHSSDTLQLRKRKSRAGAWEPQPHLSPRIPCVQALLLYTQPRSQGCHVRGNGQSIGAESPPQVVPGHDWYILRSQEMLCTAPTVIKHCCSPVAPQCVPHRPLTLQSSHTFHSPTLTLLHTAPHAPSLETPY